VFDAKHWPSDVAVGAGIGTLAGRAAVAYGRAHPHGWPERMVGAVAVAPTTGGGFAGGARMATR
jgi:membrane-associated phospholipid phosphatase